MTKNEKIFVIACAIGDGCINKRYVNGYSCYRFLMKHSEKQKDYFLYKAYQLDQILGKRRKVPYTVYKNSGRSKINALQFEKNSNKYLKSIYNLIYRNGKKTYSKPLLNLLNEEALAIWYMDDGSLSHSTYKRKDGFEYYSKCRAVLNTYTNYEEALILQQYFKNKWDINWNIHKSTTDTGKLFYRLTMGTREFRKFKKIIEPYIHPSMYYKIHLKIGLEKVNSQRETSKVNTTR
jgi:hypothetical protein